MSDVCNSENLIKMRRKKWKNR